MKSSKGGRFERRVCKELSLWYSKNVFGEETDDLFWRTAGSGARATVRMKKKKDTTNSCGDICCLDERASPLLKKYFFELKNGYTSKATIKTNKKTGRKTILQRKGISLTEIVDRNLKTNKPILIEWIEKARREAKQHRIKHPIIIFQRDRKRACIVLSMKLWDEVLLNNQKRWMYPNDGPSCMCHIDDLDFIVLCLEDFLHWCDPNALFGIVKKRKSTIPRRKQKECKKGKYGGKKISNFKG